MKGSSNIIVATLLAAIAPTISGRTFTSKEGVKVEAEIVQVEERKVTIRLVKGGQILTFPVDSLIPGDQAFVEAWKPAPNPAFAPNYDAPWPDRVGLEEPPKIDIVEEDREKKRFVYHSSHYQFICDVRLNKSLVGKFAKMFETTFQAMVELPMNFEKARKFDSKDRLKIQLFEKKETYMQNGGLPGSAGVYRGGSDTVLVPLTSLGVKPLGSGYIIDRDVSNKTLVHELVHQLTDRLYYMPGSRGWFTEGIAEYIAVSPYKNGRIKFRNNLDEIKNYATGFSKKYNRGRNLGTELTLKNLKEYMLLPYEEFANFGGQANFNYGMGLILTTWLIHMDDDGSRKNLTAFLKAMKEKKHGNDLLKVLLAGRTWEEFEKEITVGWKRKGIKIQFQNSSSES